MTHRTPLSFARLLLVTGVSILAALTSPPLIAKQPPAFIVPGPRSVTAEEKSLAPDPSKGSEHGVILAIESERDERVSGLTCASHRFRAKIFSNDGRNLGDVQIPITQKSVLQNFWGWTLLPDGTVLELKKEDLREQVIVDSRSGKVSAMKGSLPGIVPGCVIEYGYQLTQPEVYRSLRVELQSAWPIRTLKYRWFPMRGLITPSYLLSRTERLPIEFVKDSTESLLVTGHDIPAVVEEPFMPPIKEVRAAATLYYRYGPDAMKDYWKNVAVIHSTVADSFAKSLVLKDYLERMNVPSDGGLSAKLKAVHQWLSTHVKHASFRTAEEEEASKDDKNPSKAKSVLESGRAVGRQLDYLFYGYAKLLGADAYIVLTTDRTDHFFNPLLLSEDQFNYSLVAVHLPGEPADQFTFVDTGSGVAYGELPWWISGSRGFMADPKVAKVVVLHAPDPLKNASETKTAISFNLEEGTASVHWSRSDSGQAGRSDRISLRGDSPEDRRKRLEELCGAFGSFEVTRAEAPGLEDLNRGLHLECEGTLNDTNFTAQTTRYSFQFDGSWEEQVPELTAPTRVHPVIFSFPRIDQNVIEIAAPAGFTTVAPPAVTQLDSPFGHYGLSVKATPAGYHVERVFALSTIGVTAAEYDPLRRFLADVRQADRTPVEFRKAE